MVVQLTVNQQVIDSSSITTANISDDGRGWSKAQHCKC